MEYDTAVEDAKKKIREHAYYMKKALDGQNLKLAMKSAETMISNLRVGNVSPRDYYMLFMLVFDELNILELAFRDVYNKKKLKFSKIYEKVQYSFEIIPRLYLMITAGSVLIDTKEMTSSAVIQDLFQMLKGVQHPFRGLFLRYYFLKMIKTKIPDADEEGYKEKLEREFGCLENILDMLCENLGEMNKLWIRIGSLIKDKKKRKQERGDLKITVGENIVRLASIQGLTVDIYKQKLLPALLEHIVSCGDKISQQYLMDCIVHAFSDEFHLETLEILLRATEDLNPKVNLREIYIKLMERFADFSKNAEAEHLKVDMGSIYKMFKNSISNVVNKQQQGEEIEIYKLLELQAAFIKFCVHTFPDKIGYVDEILQISVTLCNKVRQADFTEEILEFIVQILIHPLETMSITVLNLAQYPKLMSHLPFAKRKRVATKIVEAVISSRTYLVNTDILNRLMSFILPLVEEQDDSVYPSQAELESELSLVSRLLWFVQSHNPLITHQMLKMFDVKFKKLPAEWRKLTLPALFTAYCKVARRVIEVKKLMTEEDAEAKIRQGWDFIDSATYLSEADRITFNFKIESLEFDFMTLFKQCNDIVEDISIDYPKIAVRLGLQLALLISECDPGKEYEEFQSDLCSEMLELFQDEVSEPKEKVFFLEFIIGTFCQIKNLSDENRDSLIRNTTMFASSLLKKKDKVLMLLKSSCLYFHEGYKDEERVSDILRKALKFAKNATKRDTENAAVYVNILDKIIYLLEKDLHSMTAEGINICMDIIKENLSKVSPKTKDAMEDYLDRLVVYLKKRKNEMPEKFGEAKV